MAKGKDRTEPCSKLVADGRMVKAQQFMEVAEDIATLTDDSTDIADAYVTMCVHAGIAAADVICCRRLGEHARGEDHASAVSLVGTASAIAAKNLRTLLGMKTKAGYSGLPVSGSDYKRAGRAARALVDEAQKS